jgi:uncharacterized alpha/beta hydrolase family protein
MRTMVARHVGTSIVQTVLIVANATRKTPHIDIATNSRSYPILFLLGMSGFDDSDKLVPKDA